MTVLLIVIELIAFAWLIIDIRKSKKKQDQIITLENQILDIEKKIMGLEEKIIQKIDVLIKQKNS
ncbi:MAG: hypothetical protein CBC44_003400 [Flavobacteriales bacterium TMED84]|nr:MAG: hypothetical protein CBC44_003400 [Flavobacteriales bacterium TMED84]